MTDYLSGLAARALGVANVVRPRPVARFEPPPVEELEPSSMSERPRPVHRAVERPSAAAEPARTSPAREPVVAMRREAGPASFAPASPVEPVRPARSVLPEPPPPRPNRESTAPRAERAETAPAAPKIAAEVSRHPATPTRRETRREAYASLRAAAAPEPPAVHVTIGRIEVRAVAPPVPTPARRTPRHPAPLALDEYLEQRRSGRR